jgi:hypothetical protein
MHRNESAEIKELIGAALEILGQDGPMTLRQLFWRLVSAGEMHNDVESYGHLGQIISKVLEEGRCSSEWIVDQSRAASTIDAN